MASSAGAFTQLQSDSSNRLPSDTLEIRACIFKLERERMLSGKNIFVTLQVFLMSQSNMEAFVLPGPGQVVCLVAYDQQGELHITPEATAALQLLKGPLAVVSVCGRAGQGKTYLLNQLLGRRSGFPLGPTKGLWMWTTPSVCTAPDGSHYHLLILDTEGYHLETGSPHLFVLSLLLSSLAIYNQMGGFDEGSLEEWGFVTEMHRRIQLQTTTSTLAPPPQMPVLLWLLRDYDSELSPHCLAPPLEVVPGTSQLDQRNNKECLQLPSPLTAEGQLQGLETMPIQELRPEFLSALATLNEVMLGRALSTTRDRATLTGPVLASFTHSFLEALHAWIRPPTPVNTAQAWSENKETFGPHAPEAPWLSNLSCQLSLVQGDQGDVKQQVKACVAAAGDDPAAASLLTQLYCVEGEYERALKLLMASSPPGPLQLSNASYIHRRMGKLSLASLYAAKALKAQAAEGAELEGSNSLFRMMYHAALCVLQQGNARVAATCFEHATYLKQDVPLLWLRLAESLIRMHCFGEMESNPGTEPQDSQDEEKVYPSLKAAKSCLQNALQWLIGVGRGSSGLDSQFAIGLAQCAYANLAYVDLALRDFAAAAEVADNLLKLPSCLPVYKALADHYLAEAAFATQKVSKALDYVSQDSDEKGNGYRDGSGPACRLRLAGNVALIHSNLGDMRQAQLVLEGPGTLQITLQEKLVDVYVKLLSGARIDQTLAVLESVEPEDWIEDATIL